MCTTSLLAAPDLIDRGALDGANRSWPPACPRRRGTGDRADPLPRRHPWPAPVGAGRVAEARTDALAFLDHPNGARHAGNAGRGPADRCRGVPPRGRPPNRGPLIDDDCGPRWPLGCRARSRPACARRAAGRGRGRAGAAAQVGGVLETSPRRLELASSLVALGAALRRARQPVPAREPLRRGLDSPTPAVRPRWPRAPTPSCSPPAPARSRRATTRRGRAHRHRAPRRRPRGLGVEHPQIAQALFVTPDGGDAPSRRVPQARGQLRAS